MPLDYLSELKESCAIAKSRSLTVTRATKITEWKSALTPSHDAQVLGPYRLPNPVHLTVLAAKSEDYTTNATLYGSCKAANPRGNLQAD